MAANVRYRSTYYNTTGTPTTWIIEILDTESVAGVVKFQTDASPNESFEGLSDNLNPGIYPSMIQFGMYLRSTPRTIGANVYGTTIDFVDDIISSAEGRFLAKLYKDGVMHFVGPIIYDQCSYSDESIPLLSITAVDGLNRLSTTDYVSQVGELRYYSRTQKSFVYDNSPLLYDGIVSPVTLIEHIVENSPAGVGGGVLYTATTTWVWREIYAIDSPGAGWTFQGQGRWTTEVDYTNELITEFVDSRYHLTRDIDDAKHRTVAEFMYRAMLETKMDGEYSGVMYDVAMEWREHSMTTGDPTALMRIHEEAFIGGTWESGMKEICRLLNMRIYYSKGRYHFEQISIRDNTTFTRYIYDADGTSGGADETASLDLDFSALTIEPITGGLTKFLPPLKSVEASISLDNANLLDGVNWNDGYLGERYLGRIKQVDGDQKVYIELNGAITSTFDPTILLLFGQSFINLICEHTVTVYYTVRINNINTGTTYWLDQGAGTGSIGTWETNIADLHHAETRFGQPTRRYSVENYGYTVDRRFYTLAETLPGSTGDMYDIHVSLRIAIAFQSPAGSVFWITTFPDKFWTLYNTHDNIFKIYSTADLNTDVKDWVEADGSSDLVYVAENDVANSVKVTTEVKWADTGQHEKSIEIYNGTDWQRSAEWSIGGIGTPKVIMELLVYEIMSLRTVPRKIYSGGFASSIPNTENRFQRGTDYYLPLACTRDSDVDLFSGQFLQIAKTTPPDVTGIVNPIAGSPLPGQTDFNGIDPPSEPTLYFETNEVITAGSTLTECDIVNTLLVYVASGETVAIVNTATGESENVTLTQEINPSDTVMYFESNVMAYSYPDGSPIVIQDGDVVIESGGSKYFYSNELYNGSTHTVPISAIDMSVLAGLSPTQITKKIVIDRGGARMFAKETPTEPSPQLFWIDTGTNEIIFHLEVVDEQIIIDIDLNR